MQIGGGGRGMVEEGKGATFTDAKGFAVPSHPPWISHCLADHVSMSLFFLYQIIPPVEKDPAGFPIYVFVIIAVVLGAMLLIIVLVRRKKRQRKYDLQRESLITASAHAQ